MSKAVSICCLPRTTPPAPPYAYWLCPDSNWQVLLVKRKCSLSGCFFRLMISEDQRPPLTTMILKFKRKKVSSFPKYLWRCFLRTYFVYAILLMILAILIQCLARINIHDHATAIETTMEKHYVVSGSTKTIRSIREKCLNCDDFWSFNPNPQTCLLVLPNPLAQIVHNANFGGENGAEEQLYYDPENLDCNGSSPHF